jgi:hypothetical protein
MRRISAPFKMGRHAFQTAMFRVSQNEPPRRQERQGRTAKISFLGEKKILLGVFLGVCGVLAVGLGRTLVGARLVTSGGRP